MDEEFRVNRSTVGTQQSQKANPFQENLLNVSYSQKKQRVQVIKDEMQEHYHGDTNVLKNRSFVTNLLNQELTPSKPTEINNDDFEQPQVEEVRAGTWVPPQRDMNL
jgi:hypothetical protein